MRLLFVHADRISWEPTKKAIKDAEEGKAGSAEEALVAFTAVERSDEADPKAAAAKAVAELQNVLGQVKAKRIVLYPYAHLSTELSSPAAARAALDEMESLLRKAKVEVQRAPFGWYKAFELKAKGHPLSELSRSIGSAAKKPERMQAQKPVNVAAALRKSKPEAASATDHRIIGAKLDLFSFQEPAPGIPFYHPKGLVLRNQLIEFLRKEQDKRGYQEILTPELMNQTLWHISGHWDHYKENMFFSEVDGTQFALKPMNCPGAILFYRNAMRSYRELPIRASEFGTIHRNERSGVLSGLFRVRGFTMDDAHLFVTPEQLEAEIAQTIELVKAVYGVFGFPFHVELSTKPEKSMGDPKLWEKAEAALASALKREKMEHKVNAGDGAFYGPKIDFHIKDSLGRTWQCGTVQVDFQMPERFELSYTGEDGKEHRPIIIHRAIFGSLDRFIGILVEHYQGAFPVWLAPIQARVLSFTDRNVPAAQTLLAELRAAGIRADSDFSNATVNGKVRDAELQKIPYILTIGDREEKDGTVAVRRFGQTKLISPEHPEWRQLPAAFKATAKGDAPPVVTKGAAKIEPMKRERLLADLQAALQRRG